MFIVKLKKAFSSYKQIHEYEAATHYISQKNYGQAYSMLNRVINIIKPHEDLPAELLKMTYSVAQKLGPKEENAILMHNLKRQGNILQYMKNNLFLDSQTAMHLVDKYESNFYNTPAITDYKRISLYAHLLNHSRDVDYCIQELVQYSEDKIQRNQTLIDIALSQWLRQIPNFNPSRLEYQIPTELIQELIDHFQNAEARINYFPNQFNIKFYKAYQDFLISTNAHRINKTIVGQIFNSYLKFCEKKCKEQLYLPLLGLGWLHYEEQKYLSAEGLFRNVYDQLSQQPTSNNHDIILSQYRFLYCKLLKKLDKRQTEYEQIQQQIKKSSKIPNNIQIANLYISLQDYPITF